MIEESDDDQNAYLAVHIPQVQRQCGSNDCGVVAIAFALHAALGHCVGDITFDQSKLRNHLLQCFKTRKLTPFPTVDKKARKIAESYFEVKVDVFYTCMMPDTYGDMVQCGTCQRCGTIKNVLIYLGFLLKTSGGVAFHVPDIILLFCINNIALISLKALN